MLPQIEDPEGSYVLVTVTVDGQMPPPFITYEPGGTFKFLTLSPDDVGTYEVEISITD